MNVRLPRLLTILFLAFTSESYSQETSLSINSMLNNAAGRPPVTAGNGAGEIRGISGSGTWADDGFLRLSAGGGSTPATKCYIDISGYTADAGNDRYENIIFGTVGQERMRVDINGNVGIGTTRPTDKLSVNGTVTAKRVRVTQSVWPDYVFDSTYHLPSLESVEKYVKEHKHLEGIPSAAIIEKDDLDLGSMQALMLKKMEEMTLYLIELKKENAALREEIEKIKTK